VNYGNFMGVSRLSASSDFGDGIRIAVLDSGVPPPGVLRGGWNECLAEEYRDNPDEFGHATEIASILVGGGGIVGLCEYVIPIFIKVLDSKGCGNVKSVSRGIYRAIDEGADIINLSLGFVRTEKCPDELEMACKAAFDAGKTVICAAGNDSGPVNWPAALPTTISIGSSREDGLKTYFSSVGEVDFVAPGINLPVMGLSGKIKKVKGTSFSAAIVTGLTALLLADKIDRKGKYGRFDRPDSSMKSVMAALRTISRDVGYPGWDSDTGYGAICGRRLNNDPTVGLPVCGEMTSGSFFDTMARGMKRFIKQIKTKGEKNGRV
jgi:subtilisin family serine protease